jgi:O-antigen ligase
MAGRATSPTRAGSSEIVLSVIDSWWFNGLFFLAGILNLVLFGPDNIGPWYGGFLGGIVMLAIVAAGLKSTPLTLVAMAGLIVLVIVGVVSRIMQKRDTTGTSHDGLQ